MGSIFFIIEYSCIYISSQASISVRNTFRLCKMPMQYITVLLVIVSHCSCKDKENLFFQLYVSNSSSVDASVGIPAINYALQLINNDSSLLPNYNLTYIEVQNPEVNT